MKKILCFVFLLIFLFSAFPSLVLTAYAEAESEIDLDFSDKAKGVYLYSYDADRVLFSQEAEEKLLPSATAKMMAGILVCEKYSDILDRIITITENMLKGHSGTSMNLKSGMTLTVRDLLYGTVCGGNNDAALALATACAGSVSEFVAQMNKYARLLDMRNTQYSNPTGLDSDTSFTTLGDTAKLARKASQNTLYVEISSAASYVIEEYSLTVYNRNALISQFSAQGYVNKNARGLIAGSTDNGGYVLATIAEKNGMCLLCVVLGASSDQAEIYSYDIANRLLNYAFNSYSLKKIAKAGSVFDTLEVELALTDKNGANVSCVACEDVYAFLPDDVTPQMLTYETYFHEDKLTAPVEKGKIVGSVIVYYDGIFITEAPLMISDTIKPNVILLSLEHIKNFFLGRVFWIAVILATPTIAIYLHLSRRSRRKTVSTVKFKKFY